MELIQNYIYEQVAEKKLSVQNAEKMLKEIIQSKATSNDSIAIIGMSGKYPGSDSLREFWESIVNRRKFLGDFPDERKFDGEHMLEYPFYGEILMGVGITKENVCYPKGGYLKSGIDKFDWDFFGISPREALYIDPSNRLVLETAWEAIEDAGYGGKRIYGSRTGVFVGQDTTNISLYKHMTEMDTMHLTGSWAGYLSSRIAYLLNLTGPAMVIDTACSSGLVSVHNACKSIQNGECDMALAGGINILYMAQKPKEEKVIMDLSIVESENNTVRPFDDRANGTLWGEGVGVFVLKPLKKALKDRDNIHAIIKGSAINNDGASNGITAPNAIAQENVICEAWRNAKVDPETISYIEAHGTATKLGDSIELKGLNEAFRRFTDKKQFCAIGSAKGSIGHTVAASGIAGLSKIIMGMEQRKIPPCSSFDRPNQYIDFCNSPIYVSNRTTEWIPNGELRRAGISSFGFTGTNCHVVIEEAPSRDEDRVLDNRPHIFTLSAKKDSILVDYLHKYEEYLMENKDQELLDLCYTASCGRGHYEYRIAIISDSIDELSKKIHTLCSEGLNTYTDSGIHYGRFKLITGRSDNLDEGFLSEELKGELDSTGNEIISKWLGNPAAPVKMLDQICELYIKGADIDWHRMYDSTTPYTVSLPFYPLERNRCWAAPKLSTLEYYAAFNSNRVHHLLIDWVVSDVKDHCVYSSIFNVKKKWVISEHKFLDNYVLPGISYLELGRKACSRFYGDTEIELRDVIFMEALVVEEKEDKIAFTSVENRGTHLYFQIISKEVLADGNERWATHAEGKAYKITENVERIDIDNLYQDFNVPEIDLDNDIGKKEFTLGERWDTIRSIKIKDDRSLVELELKEKFADDLEGLIMHPSLLDNAANAVLLQIKSDIYLPFSYKSLKVYNKFPLKVISYIRCLDEINTGRETISFDVTLYDEYGQVLVDIEHYTIKKVNKSEQRKFENLAGKGIQYLRIGWETEEVPLDINYDDQILVIGSDNKRTSGIVSELRKKGVSITVARPGQEFTECKDSDFTVGDAKEDYDRLAAVIKEKQIHNILHLRSFDVDGHISNIEDLEKSQNAGVYSLFCLTKSILDIQIKQKIKITLVTTNVDSVNGDETTLNPQHSTLSGLGKVIIQEYPNIEVRSIDCDTETEDELLVNEICSKDSFYKVAYRKGIRYVEELKRVDQLNEQSELPVKCNGVYVITGGTGGVGLTMGEHLSKKGTVHLVLINRSTFPIVDEWETILDKNDDPVICGKITRLKKIIENGSTVDTISIDISNEVEVEEAFSDIKKKYGRIDGILHCAGLPGEGYIMNKNLDVFKNVLLPKVNGTWILGNFAKRENPDFFVLFSSVVTLQSLPGQSDYTSANSYLDSFASWGRKNGINVISINWPGWKDTGMAKDYNISDENMFFRLITREKAVEAFDSILGMGESRVLVGELNHKALDTQKDQLLISLSTELIDAVRKFVSGSKRDKSYQLAVENVTLFGKKDGVYTKNETFVGKIFGGVLGLPEVDIYKTFNELGGDSILSTQVYKEIDAVYPGVIDITDIFSYPTVVEMGNYIDTALAEDDIVAIDKPDCDEELDSKLMNLIDGLEKGEVNIEEELDSI